MSEAVYESKQAGQPGTAGQAGRKTKQAKKTKKRQANKQASRQTRWGVAYYPRKAGKTSAEDVKKKKTFSIKKKAITKRISFIHRHKLLLYQQVQ